MKRFAKIIPVGGSLLLLAFVYAACGGGNERQEAPAEEMTSAEMALPDTTGASVWAYLQQVDYQNTWSLWPEKGELYTGQEPHGMLLTTYLNDVAYEALMNKAGAMPPGAIIVKENYMPDSSLAAVTVMYKVEGYNALHNDWFFSKHRPDGSLDRSPEGMALEGRVPGCQNCHMGRKDNDYIFTGALQ
ncbi:MAG: hypothetical protein KatS3mg044_0327 [Rhodothermaceae bacterium]|nr:MAG: hypothetical protein KatS3mg044_0327 [Rhodothermaceae bacterium]